MLQRDWRDQWGKRQAPDRSQEGFAFLWRVALLVVLLAALIPRAQAQLPDLRTYEIACNPDDFANILAHPHEDIYIPCEVVYDGRVWHNVRLRIRGDSSRDYPKKSLKLNFDADERFFGRDKINLNSEWRDASYAHEYLSYEFFRRAGLPACITHYARVVVNGEYQGLYLDVEQVDEMFLEREGLDPASSMYKAARDGAMLRADEPVEELWTKETGPVSGFLDLKALIRWIDTVPEDRFYDELGIQFDRDLLARHMAVNTLIANSSTYYHNYYLARPPGPNGRWIILPWDMDRSHRYWGAWMSEPRYYVSNSPHAEGVNALVTRCWRDPRMRADIFAQVEGLADSLVAGDYYDTITAHLDTLLADAVENDPQNQFTLADFHENLLRIPGDIEQRAAYMIDASTLFPFPFDVHTAQSGKDTLRLSWEPTTTGEGDTVSYEVLVDDDHTLPSPQLFSTGSDTELVITGLSPAEMFWNVQATSASGRYSYSERYYMPAHIDGTGAHGTTAGGTLAGDVVWTAADSPYWVEEDLVVPAGASLMLEPGTVAAFSPGTGLEVEGQLNAVATPDASIQLKAASIQHPWHGVTVQGEEARVHLRGLAIEGASLTVQQGAVAWLDSSSFRGTGGQITVSQATLHLTASTWLEAQGTVLEVDGGWAALQDVAIQAGTGNQEPLIDANLASGDSLSLSDLLLAPTTGEAVQLALQGGHLDLDRCRIAGGVGSHGISLSASDGQAAISNLLVTGCDTALTLDGAVDVSLLNGVFAHNTTALAGPGSGMTVRNVVFWQNGTTFAPAGPPEDLGWCYLPEDVNVSGFGNQSGNEPGFADGWYGDYHLREDSPLIDAGFGTNVPLKDGDGFDRLDVPGIENRGAGTLKYVDIGMYEFQEGVVPPPPPPVALPGGGQPLFIYPNPTNDRATLVFTLEEAGVADVAVFNILGQRVFTRHLSGLAAGRHTLSWSPVQEQGSPLASGLYICRIKQASGTYTRKLLLVR